MRVCPLSFTYAHQHYGMVFPDDQLTISRPYPKTMEISSMLGMDKNIRSQLKNKLKSIYKYSEFFSNVTLQMPEAQKYPYSFQSLCSVIVARKVVKVEPAWNSKFEKRVPYKYEDLSPIVETLFRKYQRLHKSEYKLDQKENKIHTVKVDINKGKILNSENKNPLHKPHPVSDKLTRHTVSSSRKTQSFLGRQKKDTYQRNKSKGSFNAKQFHTTFSRNESLNMKSRISGGSISISKEVNLFLI